MVYLDNAATTYPKPDSVISGMTVAMVKYGGNPGRSGHKLSVETSQRVYESRSLCAEFFGAEPENTVFSLNCTYALNTAIKGLALKNAHLIISDLEHNAVLRPVHAASKENGISYSVFKVSENDEETVKNIERLITQRTVAVITTAASNVTGQILPIEKIGALCKRHNICYVVDAAQGSGVMPISLDMNINIICSAGHKGLYGPMGTGLMITDGKYPLKTIIEGGTGSNSSSAEQPEILPDRFESGTINTAGAISLGKGIEFVNKKGIERIFKHEKSLCDYFREKLRSNPNIIIYNDFKTAKTVPLVPFNIKGMTSTESAAALSSAGFYMRGGLHCAILAHKKLGTDETGVVRFSPSVFTTKNDVTSLIRTLSRMAI